MSMSKQFICKHHKKTREIQHNLKLRGTCFFYLFPLAHTCTCACASSTLFFWMLLFPSVRQAHGSTLPSTRPGYDRKVTGGWAQQGNWIPSLAPSLHKAAVSDLKAQHLGRNLLYFLCDTLVVYSNFLFLRPIYNQLELKDGLLNVASYECVISFSFHVNASLT